MVETALADYAAAVTAVREGGLTRALPADVVERFFALGFSLEQMRQNMDDLDRRIADWAAVPAPRTGGGPE
jgi:hypothetical protein